MGATQHQRRGLTTPVVHKDCGSVEWFPVGGGWRTSRAVSVIGLHDGRGVAMIGSAMQVPPHATVFVERIKDGARVVVKPMVPRRMGVLR